MPLTITLPDLPTPPGALYLAVTGAELRAQITHRIAELRAEADAATGMHHLHGPPPAADESEHERSHAHRRIAPAIRWLGFLAAHLEAERTYQLDAAEAHRLIGPHYGIG